MKNSLPWLLSVLSGVLGFLGYIGFDHFYLEWFFLVPLLMAVRSATPGTSFFLGWTAGTVGYAGGFYWFIYLLNVFTGLNILLSCAGLALFSIFNGLSLAVFAWAIRRLELNRKWVAWWTAPFIWTALENMYPVIFPNYIGASQYPLLVFSQMADITGILGVSFLLIWCNGTIYAVAANLIERKKFPFREVSASLAAIAISATYGTVRLSQVDGEVKEAPKINVSIIQAGVGEAEKHMKREDFIKIHKLMSRSADESYGSDLIIWPETVIDGHLGRGTATLSREYFTDIAKPVLFGAMTSEKKGDRRLKYNSAVLIDEHSNVLGMYDKRILVPFGEFIPFGDVFPELYKWMPYTSRFSHGSSSDPLPFGQYKLSLNICYEDLFPGLIRDLMNTAPPPHAIINLTNDSWYGNTTEPMEHLMLASFRAIENRRALLRATNTGISAIIDPAGRVRKRSGQWTQEVVYGEVPMMSGRTIYGYAGNWFGLTVSILALVMIGLSFRKQQAKAVTERRTG